MACDIPGGRWRFDAESVRAVNALWGWNSDDGQGIGTTKAAIYRVPLHQAETIAFRMFEIAVGCRPDHVTRPADSFARDDVAHDKESRTARRRHVHATQR